jgi:hypothetical protein
MRRPSLTSKVMQCLETLAIAGREKIETCQNTKMRNELKKAVDYVERLSSWLGSSKT